MSYASLIPSGQNTTGKFFLQLNTGRGFTEIVTSGISGQLVGVFTQPMKTDYDSPRSGFYKFGLTKTRFLTGDFSYNYGGFGSEACPVHQLTFDTAVDRILITKGGCSFGPLGQQGDYYGNPVDCRKAIWYTEQHNFIIGGSHSGIHNYDEFGGSWSRVACDNSINGPWNPGCLEYYPPGQKNSILGGEFNHIYGTESNRTIGGGCRNVIYGSRESVIAGGNYNCLWDSERSTIGGGNNNRFCNASYGFIGGGSVNHICSNGHSSIVGGSNNKICGGSTASAIAGGGLNLHCNSSYSFIGGGINNTTCLGASVIGGGENNLICNVTSSIHGDGIIVGGKNNCMSASMSFLGGGSLNQAGTFGGIENYQTFLFLGGGCGNYLMGNAPSIVGGICNRLISNKSFIGNGYRNCIDTTSGNLASNPANYATLFAAQVIPTESAIVGGRYNKIMNRSQFSFVGAGADNQIWDSPTSMILAGSGNLISGAPNSFIIGSRGFILATGKNYPTSYSPSLGLGRNGFQVSGVGLLTDGYSSYYNPFYSKTLNLSFRYGTIFNPYINLVNNINPVNVDFSGEIQDYNMGIFTLYPQWSGQYNGYTGWVTRLKDGTEPMTLAKMIQIGSNFDGNFASDISGLYGAGDKRLLRLYNPSILIGADNSGSHQNILIGTNNISFHTPAEFITTGVYGPGATGLPVKSLRNSPWPFNKSTWPYYQGMNTLIGHGNYSTGAMVNVFGHGNFIRHNAGPTLILGYSNFLIPTGGIYQTGSGGYITGYFEPNLSGPIQFKRNTVIVGFNNSETYGNYSNLIGTNNTSYARYGNTLGYYNYISGEKPNTFGYSNINQGIANISFGYQNYVLDGQNNFLIGNNNILYKLHPTGAIYPVSNSVLGNLNYLAGSNGVVLGTRNRFGANTGVNPVDSILIGNTNISETSHAVLIGAFNSSSGFRSYTIGANNIISGTYQNGIYGVHNVNYGNNAYILGNNNDVYNEGGIAIGNYAFAYNRNQVSIAGGSNGTSWPGSSQKTHLFWKGVTSGASNMELMLDGVFHDGTYISGKAYIPSGVIWNGTVNVIGSETGLGNALVQLRSVSAANKNGFIHLLNNTSLNSATTGTVTWGVGITPDSTNKALAVTATGVAGKVIYWSVIGEFNEAFIPTNEGVSVNRFLNNSIVGQTIANTTFTANNINDATVPLDPRLPGINANGSYYPGA